MRIYGQCCDDHDFCYAKCGVLRSECDKPFSACILSVCDVYAETNGNHSDYAKCKKKLPFEKTPVS